MVEAPRGADVRALVERFRERYPDVELRVRRPRERTVRSLFEVQDALRDEFTERQWEAFQTGSFEWPRETGGEAVAELLGITRPTFDGRLRLAERTAVRMLTDRESSRADG